MKRDSQRWGGVCLALVLTLPLTLTGCRMWSWGAEEPEVVIGCDASGTPCEHCVQQAAGPPSYLDHGPNLTGTHFPPASSATEQSLLLQEEMDRTAYRFENTEESIRALEARLEEAEAALTRSEQQLAAAQAESKQCSSQQQALLANVTALQAQLDAYERQSADERAADRQHIDALADSLDGLLTIIESVAAEAGTPTP